jgi:hypothetical protein
MSPAALKPLILKSIGLISLIGLINFPREANPDIAQPERRRPFFAKLSFFRTKESAILLQSGYIYLKI